MHGILLNVWKREKNNLEGKDVVTFESFCLSGGESNIGFIFFWFSKELTIAVGLGRLKLRKV